MWDPWLGCARRVTKPALRSPRLKFPPEPAPGPHAAPGRRVADSPWLRTAGSPRKCGFSLRLRRLDYRGASAQSAHSTDSAGAGGAGAGGDARVPGLPDFTPPYSSSSLPLQLLCLQTPFPALRGQTPAQPKSPLPCQAFPGPPFDLVYPSGPCLLAPAPDSAWSLLHLSPGALCQGQALAWTWDVSPLALNQRGR